MKNNQLKIITHIQIKDLDDCTNQELKKVDGRQLNKVVGGLWASDWALNWPRKCPGGVLNGLLYGTC
ncbi:MAG: hypothetical protein QNJ64_20860 [Crocosphaera sp.]|nr:hypothetical protein [Crocosphaera sp.]